MTHACRRWNKRLSGVIIGASEPLTSRGTFAPRGLVGVDEQDARQVVISAPRNPVEDGAGYEAAALAADGAVHAVVREGGGAGVHADDHARRAIAVPDAMYVRR